MKTVATKQKSSNQPKNDAEPESGLHLVGPEPSGLEAESDEVLLRVALTGTNDELDSTAALTMSTVADDLLCLSLVLSSGEQGDYDFGMLAYRIAKRAEIASVLARREKQAAKAVAS